MPLARCHVGPIMGQLGGSTWTMELIEALVASPFVLSYIAPGGHGRNRFSPPTCDEVLCPQHVSLKLNLTPRTTVSWSNWCFVESARDEEPRSQDYGSYPVTLAGNKRLKVLWAELLWEKNTADWLKINGWKLKRTDCIFHAHKLSTYFMVLYFSY
jgi:hypothetical protein